MPKLDEKLRKSIEQRLSIRKGIRESFEGRQFTTQHCHLCNWASNGLTLDEAIAANRAHEATHPEKLQWDAAAIPMRELTASIHDHDCKVACCACMCGCQIGPFCTLVFGPLCGVCQIQEQRGDSQHGLRVKGGE